MKRLREFAEKAAFVVALVAAVAAGLTAFLEALRKADNGQTKMDV